MADASVRLELEIFNHTFPVTCTPDLQASLESAANKLDNDLRSDLGDVRLSTGDLLNHVVALALEYLCEQSEDQSQQESAEFMERIQHVTKRIQDCDALLADS